MNYYYDYERPDDIITVAECEPSEQSYSFDIFLFLAKKGERGVYFANNSGCSCPAPFEDFRSLDDFEHITTIKRLNELERTAVETYGRWSIERPDEWRDCIAKVRAYMRENK